MDEVVEKWTQAANQGLAIVQCNLGVMYGRGQGVPQSYKEAVKWYQKAAEQGHADAQFNLGATHGNGTGVPQSFQKAAIWFQKAANQGHDEAKGALVIALDAMRRKETAVSVASTASADPSPIYCANCGIAASNLKACSRCKAVSYCGREYQVAHWKSGHKAACGT